MYGLWSVALLSSIQPKPESLDWKGFYSVSGTKSRRTRDGYFRSISLSPSGIGRAAKGLFSKGISSDGSDLGSLGLGHGKGFPLARASFGLLKAITRATSALGWLSGSQALSLLLVILCHGMTSNAKRPDPLGTEPQPK